jgi:transposase InsO family protein
MQIERNENLKINLKRIARIKNKFNLTTQRRKKSKLRSGMKEMLESNVCKNHLKQIFKSNIPGKLFSTDITYLSNKRGQRAYLSGVKDLCTREIVGYSVSLSNDVELVLNSIRGLSSTREKEILIHSDQGHQYISHIYRNYLKSKGIKQSMSRRGNCYDNAPIESFFGHLKDECEYRDWKDIKELRRKIGRYIKYYNERRPQWCLKRKTPIEYRSFLS